MKVAVAPPPVPRKVTCAYSPSNAPPDLDFDHVHPSCAGGVQTAGLAVQLPLPHFLNTLVSVMSSFTPPIDLFALMTPSLPIFGSLPALAVEASPRVAISAIPMSRQPRLVCLIRFKSSSRSMDAARRQRRGGRLSPG